MVIIADIARPGSGKTDRSIAMSKHPDFRKLSNRYVVDPEREYVLEKGITQIQYQNNIISILDWIEDSFTIIDCAHYMFPIGNITNQQKTRLYTALGGARHRGNAIYLNFHALIQVPGYIRTYIDMITLGHTNDSVDILRRYGCKNDDKLREEFLWLKTKLHKPHACSTF